jgi:hypothetical protein
LFGIAFSKRTDSSRSLVAIGSSSCSFLLIASLGLVRGLFLNARLNQFFISCANLGLVRVSCRGGSVLAAFFLLRALDSSGLNFLTVSSSCSFSSCANLGLVGGLHLSRLFQFLQLAHLSEPWTHRGVSFSRLASVLTASSHSEPWTHRRSPSRDWLQFLQLAHLSEPWTHRASQHDWLRCLQLSSYYGCFLCNEGSLICADSLFWFALALITTD